MAESVRVSGAKRKNLAAPHVAFRGTLQPRHHHDPVLIAHRQLLHQHRPEHGEHRRGHADAEPEHEHGRDHEGGRASESANGDAEVAPDAIEERRQ